MIHPNCSAVFQRVIPNDLPIYKIIFTCSPHFYTKKNSFFFPLYKIALQQVTDNHGTGGPASGFHGFKSEWWNDGVCPQISLSPLNSPHIL